MVKFAFFTKGLVHTFSQKFDVFSPCFFSFKLLKRRFRDVLDTKNLFYTTNKLIIESWKISLFCKGVSPWFWSNIWSFFTFTFLCHIDQKEFLAMFLIENELFRPKKHLYWKVAKFAFFTKWLVRDFGQKFEVFLLHFSRPNWSKRVFSNILDRKWTFLV